VPEKTIEERVEVLEKDMESLQKLPIELRNLGGDVRGLALKVSDVESRLGTVESRLGTVESRVGIVESQIVQLRTDMGVGFSATLQIIESASRATQVMFDETHKIIRAGDEETRRQMRTLHEDLVQRIGVLGEGRRRPRK
jgi:chromosome segregation ATPase